MDIRRLTREELFPLIGYDIWADEVLKYHLSPARMRIVSAPARTSKSYSAAMDAIPEGLPEFEKHEGKYYPVKSKLTWIVGPDYSTNKEFQYVWEVLVDRQLLQSLGAKLERSHNSPQQGNMVIVANWGKNRAGEVVRSTWQGMSATNERSLQGEEVDNAIMSEAAEQPSKIWERYLATRVHRATLPTTPKVAAHWIKEMIDMGEQDPSLSIEHFTFPVGANPAYDKERFRIEAKKAGARTATGNPEDDPWFAEQFLGRWVYFEGRVLPFRWEEGPMGEPSNVIDDDPSWLADATWFWSVDYGYTDPTCLLLWACGVDGKLVIVDEIYQSQLSDHDIATKVFAKNDLHGAQIAYYTGDPKRPQVARIFRDHGLPVWDRDKNAMADRAAGHKALVDALSPDPRTNLPRLFIHRRCDHLIREWKTLRRKEVGSNEWSPTAIIGPDHCFHPDTELLTTSGWKRVGDVAAGEYLATRSEDGFMTWEFNVETVENEYRGDLITWDGSRGGSFAVTENHRLLVCSQYEAKKSKLGRTRFVEAGSFADGLEANQYWVPLFSYPRDFGAGIDGGKDFAFFLGLYLAEGCRSISQGRKYVHLDNNDTGLLGRAAGGIGFPNEPSGNKKCQRLSIRSDGLFDRLGPQQRSWEKRIPRWFFDQATHGELCALLEGLMLGDGTISQFKYDTASEGLADDVQELVSRLGLTATKAQTLSAGAVVGVPGGREAPSRGSWRVRMRRMDTSHRFYHLTRDSVQREYYEGPTFCPVVPPHHTVLSRRNGRVMWIGQSFDAARYGIQTTRALRGEEEERNWLDEYNANLRRLRVRANSVPRRELVGGNPGMVAVA